MAPDRKLGSFLPEDDIPVRLLTGRTITLKVQRAAYILTRPSFLLWIVTVAVLTFPLTRGIRTAGASMPFSLAIWVAACCLSVLVFYACMYIALIFWVQPMNRGLYSLALSLASIGITAILCLALFRMTGTFAFDTATEYFGNVVLFSLAFELGFTLFVYFLRDRLIGVFESRTAFPAETLVFGRHSFAADEVLYAAAENQYARIVTTRGDVLVVASLSAIESRTAPGTALRIHRSYLVWVEAVDQASDAGGHFRLVMRNGDVLPVSRRRFRAVAARFPARDAGPGEARLP